MGFSITNVHSFFSFRRPVDLANHESKLKFTHQSFREGSRVDTGKQHRFFERAPSIRDPGPTSRFGGHHQSTPEAPFPGIISTASGGRCYQRARKERMSREWHHENCFNWADDRTATGESVGSRAGGVPDHAVAAEATERGGNPPSIITSIIFFAAALFDTSFIQRPIAMHCLPSFQTSTSIAMRLQLYSLLTMQRTVSVRSLFRIQQGSQRIPGSRQ